MKALVVGGGSIGRRHLRNLKVLGIDQLALVETERSRRENVIAEVGATGFACLDEGLGWTPDFVVVGTPTHLHAEQTLAIVRAGVHVFVEKPLSHTESGLMEMADLVDRKNLVSLVGCNMRFHPGPAKVKSLLNEGQLGKLLFARVHAGSYLPSWRPGSDYRLNYAVREETGGGCLLDFIHEIDLTRWYLGDMSEVFCVAEHLSSLEIATEDIGILVCRHESGCLSEIHMDYVQRSYERGCQIAGENGSVFWDYADRQVRWFNAISGEWTTFEQPESWDVNQMYVDEMKHFVNCVNEGKASVLPIPDAAALMRVLFAAKKSAREKKMVSVEGRSRA